MHSFGWLGRQARKQTAFPSLLLLLWAATGSLGVSAATLSDFVWEPKIFQRFVNFGTGSLQGKKFNGLNWISPKRFRSKSKSSFCSSFQPFLCFWVQQAFWSSNPVQSSRSKSDLNRSAALHRWFLSMDWWHKCSWKECGHWTHSFHISDSVTSLVLRLTGMAIH